MKARTIIFIVWLLSCRGAQAVYYDHRNVHVDSLEAVLNCPWPPQGEALLQAYMELMRGYEQTDNVRCQFYARKALTLSYSLNALRARENALYSLGLMAYGRDDWDTAVNYFQQALAVADSMRHDRRYTERDVDDCLSQLYGALGNVYNMQDRAHLAIHFYQQALPIFERHGWLQSQTILYSNVGELYLSMGNSAEAERHYSLALQKARESGDSLMMATSWLGLVKIFIDKDYEQALETGRAAYRYYSCHRAEEPGGYVDILVSLARVHLMEGHEDVKAAKAYADEALALAATTELMSETQCNVYAAACEVAMHEQRWHDALAFGLQSMHDDSLTTYGDASCYVLLAQVCTELGDKQRARTYINKVFTIMQRYATDHYQSALSQMQVLYDTEKKQAAIEQLTREKQWLTGGALLTGCVLLLLVLLFFLLWRNSRQNRRNALIKAKLDGEVAERIRIARDLHDRLGGTLTALRMTIAAGTGKVPAAASSQSTALSLTDAAIAEMRNVAHHLMPDSISRYGLRTALRDYCQALPQVSFAFVGEERWLQPSQTEDLYCIVHELVNNAVKSSGASHIMVQLLAAEDYTAVNVSDDGSGLPLAEDPRGIGFDNVRARTEALGGTLTVYSRPGEGTEINLEVRKE